jgi:hypothetical protein
MAGRHLSPTAREIPLTLAEFNQAGVPANTEGRRVLRVTLLLEVKEGGYEGDLEELRAAVGDLLADSADRLWEHPHFLSGMGVVPEVHGTASAAEWAGSDFYQASRELGFPV